MRTWQPDTCECLIEEVYNGTEIVGGGQVLHKCDAHASVSDGDLYGVLFSNPDGENKRKNTVERVLLGHDEIKGLGLEEDIPGPGGSSLGKGFKPGVVYDWSFQGTGSNRVLVFDVVGQSLTVGQKTAISNLLKQKFGEGKVQIL